MVAYCMMAGGGRTLCGTRAAQGGTIFWDLVTCGGCLAKENTKEGLAVDAVGRKVRAGPGVRRLDRGNTTLLRMAVAGEYFRKKDEAERAEGRKGMPTKEAVKKKVTAASVFRELNARKSPPKDEEFIRIVRQKSGSKTFDAKHLAWYRSMQRKGKLSAGRQSKDAN